MDFLRQFALYALTALAWGRAHRRLVLTVASVILLHGVAYIWTDVPADAVLDALRIILEA